MKIFGVGEYFAGNGSHIPPGRKEDHRLKSADREGIYGLVSRRVPTLKEISHGNPSFIKKIAAMALPGNTSVG